MCRSGKDQRVNPYKDSVKSKHINVRPYKREKYDFREEKED